MLLSEGDCIREGVSSVLDTLISLSATLTHLLESLSLTCSNRFPSPVYRSFTSRCTIIWPSALCVHIFPSFEIRAPATDSWPSRVTLTLPRQEPMSFCEPFRPQESMNAVPAMPIVPAFRIVEKASQCLHE